MRENRAGLGIKRAVPIVTEIPLMLSVVTVFDHLLKPVVRVVNGTPPATLLQQVPALASELGNIAFGLRWRVSFGR